MKILLHVSLCLAVSITAVLATPRHRSSVNRGFPFYVKEKLGNVCLEIRKVKQEVDRCCNQKDCTFEGMTYSHGSVFTAADGCNFCRCRDGSVHCTNYSRCGQAPGGSSYNYRDQVAQSYCASLSHNMSRCSAVRRECDPGVGAAPSCATICGPGSQFATSVAASFPDKMLDGFGCYATFWFMLDHPVLAPNPGPGQTDAGLLGMVTVSFGASFAACAVTDCGVNYCCCNTFKDE